jgi:hypothetical protein
MKDLTFLRKVETINTNISLLNKRRRNLIDELIDSCSHPLDFIYEYKNGRPWLICMKCGLTEEGWGCGYNLLAHAGYAKLNRIYSDDWFNCRTKSIFQNGEIVYSSLD